MQAQFKIPTQLRRGVIEIIEVSYEESIHIWLFAFRDNCVV